MLRHGHTTLAALILALAQTVFAADATISTVEDKPSVGVESKVKNASTLESQERNVDRVAIQSQDKAILTMKQMLQKRMGTGQEPELHLRLAEFLQQKASIHFRIAHAKAHQKKTKVNLKEYYSALDESIKSLTLLIAKFPNYSMVHRAHFLRGKAFEDLENKKKAAQDYLFLVQNFPQVDETIPAYMSLAQFAIDENHHALAISYLKPIELRPETPHYPFALFKLGWSYYNLHEIPTALSYIEKHIRYYRIKIEDSKVPQPSELAILENSLRDAALFYFDGLEGRLPGYSADHALEYFTKLEKGPIFGSMSIRFAKLLRAHEHEDDLNRWKQIMIQGYPTLPETLEIVNISFDHYLNKRNYKSVLATAQDMVSIYQKNPNLISKFETYNASQELLLNTAKSLRDLTIKNKNAKNVTQLSSTLAGLYDSFTHFVDAKDSRIPGVHNNLAETLFEIKEYEQATTHYRWVVENWPEGRQSVIKIQEASLKAIASRYETLRLKSQIPTDVKAIALRVESTSDMNPLIQEWITWIDDYTSKYRKKTKGIDDTFDNFTFEANRTLYSQGRIRAALDRMLKFAQSYPQSKFSVPSASLALDTYIASAEWNQTHELARDLMDISNWQPAEFNQKLYAIAADAHYKLVENLDRSKNFSEALSKSKEFFKLYGKSERLGDTLFLAGNAALSLGDEKTAELYFTRLIQEFPKSMNLGAALLSRAHLAESHLELAAAATDYNRYLQFKSTANSPSEEENYKEKILRLYWISGAFNELKTALKSVKICSSKMKPICENYSALASLNPLWNPEQEKLHDFYYQKSTQGNPDNRPIWAAAALRHSAKLSYPDRLLLLKIVAGRWDKLEPMAQYSMAAVLTEQIPLIYEYNRQDIKKFSRMKASESSIANRISKIKEIEDISAKIIALPWARLQAAVLNEVAELYVDMATELSEIPAPTNLPAAELAEYQRTIQKLVFPFEEKAQDMRNRAFEIASKSLVEDTVFAKISEPFFKANPSQAKSIQGEFQIQASVALDLEFMDAIDSDGDWTSPDKGSLADHWSKALKKENWPLVSYLLQRAETDRQEKEVLTFKPAQLSLMRAVSLAAIGAQAEALAVFEQSLDQFGYKSKIRSLMTLASYAYSHHSKQRTHELIEKLVETTQKQERVLSDAFKNEAEAFFLAYGAEWAAFKFNSTHQYELLIEASDVRDAERAKWAKERLDKIATDRKLATVSTK